MIPWTRAACAAAWVIAAGITAATSSGCTTLNNARPLEPGQHAVGVALGGPIANITNVGPIPLPHVTVEGRHGIIDRLDVNYGVHLLPLVFGVTGGHLGATYLLGKQEGAAPAIAFGQRLFGFTNRLDPRKFDRAPGDWFMSQSDLTVSWLVANQLVYGGLTGYVPFSAPNLFLTPFLGIEVRPGIDWLRIQLEGRYLAPYVNTQFAVVDWIAPGNQGGLLINLGVAFVLDTRP